eukprot:scaffold118352_cov33-Phaeocystis_antarctica.AAC.2
MHEIDRDPSGRPPRTATPPRPPSRALVRWTLVGADEGGRAFALRVRERVVKRGRSPAARTRARRAGACGPRVIRDRAGRAAGGAMKTAHVLHVV